MNINIYYGGRGLIDDPTLHVINVCQEVLEELRVNVTRYNLHELKNNDAKMQKHRSKNSIKFSLLYNIGHIHSSNFCQKSAVCCIS